MKKSFNTAAMMSLGLGLLSALPGAHASGTQSIAVNVSAHVQSPDFNVSASPGSVWLAAGSNSQLASSKDVSLKLDNTKTNMVLEVAGAGVSNKSIRLEAAKGKSLQAMVVSNSIYNTDTGTEVPLTVKIGNKTLSSVAQEILPKDDNNAVSKTAMMDVSATSSTAFEEGDYRGTMTVVFSAGV
ncbi:hypothetical protein [Pantoea sp. AMG 501]|uniref:hypothetical protein n=1 Tax=Pantoea sp. AMG 501 TaxID=2008894 RepID=UPI000B5A3345|nr:hypothetical protein [Pantoea sp. AMG 501]OWY74549.1 hypothetical protein CDN97_22870 [Pantoea sp. AMG 501]